MSIENTTPQTTADAVEPVGGLTKRFLPVAVIVAGIVGFFAFGVDQYVTFEALRDNREALIKLVDDGYAVAAVGFIVIYAVSTALSLPGGAILTIAGGFLFHAVFGTLFVVIGATIGAVGIFLVAKTALGDTLRAKAGGAVKRMEDGFRENALSYLLILRLVPLFPFFIVNIVPALLGVPLRTYVIGTFFGIIPGTFVFASVGAGLGSVFDSMDEFDPASVLTTEVVIALVGLAVLTAVPIAYKKLKTRKMKPGAADA